MLRRQSGQPDWICFVSYKDCALLFFANLVVLRALKLSSAWWCKLSPLVSGVPDFEGRSS